MKNISILVCALLLFFAISCNDNAGKGAFTVTVNYTNAVPQKAYLVEMPMGAQPRLLDSADVKSGSGSFAFKGAAAEETFYQISFSNAPFIPVINDGDDISVAVDFNATQQQYFSVNGSKATAGLKVLMDQYGKAEQSIRRLNSQLDSLRNTKSPQLDSLLTAKETSRKQAIEQLNSGLVSFIGGSESPVATIFASSLATRSVSIATLDSVLAKKSEAMQKHPAINSFRMQLAAALEKEKGQLQIGQTAPDLQMQDPNGAIVSIKQFRGKYVLVDFWASWCGPCREENPVVVAAFQKFKTKPFAVLGVSLDKDKQAWTKAIADDKLTWTHMSDLKMWESAAVSAYKFEGIPFNVLIDPQGKIVATNLRGPELALTLSKYLP